MVLQSVGFISVGPTLYFSWAKTSSIPSRTTSVLVLLCALQNAWILLSVSASIRALTSIAFGLSDFGRPVRGLKLSPHFLNHINTIVLVLQKVKNFFPEFLNSNKTETTCNILPRPTARKYDRPATSSCAKKCAAWPHLEWTARRVTICCGSGGEKIS